MKRSSDGILIDRNLNPIHSTETDVSLSHHKSVQSRHNRSTEEVAQCIDKLPQIEQNCNYCKYSSKVRN